MNERPTPETDDVAWLSNLLQYETVDANFARRLERERDDLLSRLTELEHSMPIELAKLERERDEAREAAQKAKAYKRVLKDDNANLRREAEMLNKRLIEASQRGVDLLIEQEYLRNELASERVIVDRLADLLTACERWVNQPCNIKTEVNKALMEWKEARK